MEQPAWEPFDPSSDALPETLRAFLPDTGTGGGVLVTAVSPAAEDGPWSAQAALRVAEVAGTEQGRILLIDLGIEHPTLHEALDVPLDEGISDVFQFSASLQRVARAVREGRFLFTSAGTVAAEPGRILENERWEELLRQYVDSGTTVVLHVPTSAEGAESVLGRADAVIWMAGPSDPPLAAPAGGFSGPLAWLGPPPEEPAEPVPAAENAAPEDISAVPVTEAIADEPDPFWDGSQAAGADEQRSDEAAAGEPSQERDPFAIADADFETLPPEPAGSASGPGSRRWLLVGATFVAAAVVTWIFLSRGVERAPPDAATTDDAVNVSAARVADAPTTDSPGSSAAEAGSGESGESTGDAVESVGETEPAGVVGSEPSEVAGEASPPGPAAPSGPDAPAAERVMAFGLAVNAHRRIDAARAQAAGIEARFPEIQAVLVPVSVAGSLFYRVVVGPASSLGEVEVLRESMRGYLGTSVASNAIARSTRWAFLLGEFDGRAEAERAAREAEDADIPTYLAMVRAEDGSTRHRVYAGAYANRDEASALASLLGRAGYQDAPITERTGRPAR